MPHLNWPTFDSLPGSKSQNFENLCRGLMQLHFGRFGQFKALANQPGVEFHIKLTKPCTLGQPQQWFGWQCKYHRRTQSGDLTAASRADVETSLRTTERVLPEITDWILWTPYKLSKKDQDWFYGLQSTMNLILWADDELDTYLSGDGLLLRGAYFGELIVTPHNLEEQHKAAIQPIKERWLVPVHQSINAERVIRRMLGEPGSWDQLIAVGLRLKNAAEAILRDKGSSSTELNSTVAQFGAACTAFAETLLRFHEILAQGGLDIIQQRLGERKTLISHEVSSVPRRLRTACLSIALDATNALSDMRIAQVLLDEVEEMVGVGMVALLADAGGGKTQLSAQLTASQEGRPAGILLHGRMLHRGQTLDDLARHFKINGNSLSSIEQLLASLDAAGKRANCRLPVVIDGLNEAENPKDWKPALATLSETIKSYPNVLVVCTLRTGERRRDEQRLRHESQNNSRESFAVMSLPDDIRRIESEGFGPDVDKAIEKYFGYFKINPGDAEIPAEFLQHPLTLRIFCEVTNPERKSEAKIDHFPATLTPLFEKYVANACERISQMPNLSTSYITEDVNGAVYALGLELWESNQREISDKKFRSVVSDTLRPWSSSIVNLLAQEGIIFRNPAEQPGDFLITPAYDALGGYIVANALLAKYASDKTFEWLKAPGTIAQFVGEHNHDLAFDIFNSLVALAPRRMSGSQIWKNVAPPLHNIALRLTTGLDAEHLDQDTITAVFELMRDSSKERGRLFSRLRSLRGATNYPLNAEFLDRTLRALSISDRDLSWSEWIRGDRAERFNDLLAMELKWKNDLASRTPPDRLRAIWVMWLLTSTDRELRDVATRALYWYGRGDPKCLFDLTLRSLEINDPYVPERMLASSYGVAMARHVDLHNQDFVDVTLPEYARSLYNSMFERGAPFSTTHRLIREYATRIVEIGSLHHPTLFSSDEIRRSKPPFSEGGLRDWGEKTTTKEESIGLDSPFRMDFENYTLGSLVTDRGNYDYGHAGYRKLRGQILWRVEQLGWSSELFKEVDRSIANEKQWSRTGHDAKKTDRYGKKYSWIAYFEMAGLLEDQGTHEKWSERSTKVDIDSSFTERVEKRSIVEADFLGDPQLDIKDWIAGGDLPDVDPYLQLAEVQQLEGPWLLLDGFVTQQDEERGRKLFCFMRSFLIARKEVASFVQHLSHQHLGGRWLPEIPSVIYTFAGEIPWCETFPNNEATKFSFVTKEETVMVEKLQPEFFLDGKKLEMTEFDAFQHHVLGKVLGHKKSLGLIDDEDFERVEVRQMPVQIEEVKREYAEFNALIPVCEFGWEGYQSAASDAGHATVLAKEIASDLELVGKPQSFDLFTKEGVRATLNVADQGHDYHNYQKMFFIKEDLLRAYLGKNDVALVWAIWGEREYSSNQINMLFHGPNRPEQTHAVYSYIKKLV